MKLITYVINMDSAPERMIHMKSELQRLGITYIRQPGVAGIDLKHPHPDFSDFSYKYLHGRLWSPRELGCYLSHIECLRKFMESDNDYALILEDDVTLHPELLNIIKFATHINDEWNMLRLSTVNSGKWWSVKNFKEFSFSICLTREKGAGGYVVDRLAAAQILKYFLPMRLAWDIAFDLEWFFGFKTLGVFPMPANQKSNFETQIQQDINKIKIKKIQNYITVIPFRFFIELSRLIYRLSRLIKLKLKWFFSVG